MGFEKVTVNLSEDTPYAENHNRLSRLKRRLTHRFAIKMIVRHCGENSGLRLFDIGTGSGTFLAEVRRKIKNSVLKGVEYDPRLVRLVNDSLSCDVVFEGNAESFPVCAPASWDVVTSFQVIEHLYHPERMIGMARELLKDDGLLLITTPNLDCISRLVHGGRWQGYRFDHVSLKSSQEWNELILSLGFEKIFVGTTFFSGLRLFKFFPFNILNGGLSFCFGALNWNYGESFFGLYRKMR